MKDVLELETRREIYDLIAKNPGLHLSKIAESLHMRVSLVEYHILYLIKNDVITGNKESGYIRFYVKDKIGTMDKKTLSILRQKVPLRIILLLLKKDISQHKEILQEIDVAASTLSYHLKKLVNCNIISMKSYGDEKGYSVVDREQLIHLIIHYKPYNLIEGFAEIWVDLKVD